MRRHALLAVALCLLGVSPSYAWGEKGHRIVALIAQDNLTPAAKAAFADLLSVETDTRLDPIAQNE